MRKLMRNVHFGNLKCNGDDKTGMFWGFTIKSAYHYNNHAHIKLNQELLILQGCVRMQILNISARRFIL